MNNNEWNKLTTEEQDRINGESYDAMTIDENEEL